MKSRSFTTIAILLVALILGIAYQNQIVNATENSPRIIKQAALTELEDLEIDKKKDQKRLDKAIKELQKSLDGKYWEDDYTLNMMGKKVFSQEKHAVKELEKIKSIDTSSIILLLVEADRLLAQIAIDRISSDSDNKQVQKILSKTTKEMEDAQKDIHKGKFEKAIDHYKKAWKLAKMGEEIDVFDDEEGMVDFSNDGLVDYYYKLQYTGNGKKPVKLDYKFQDECVDDGPWDGPTSGGDTFEDASVKVGVTNFGNAPGLTWMDNGIKIWNKWFQKNDDNKIVDVALFPTWRPSPFPGDDNGDDLIQSNGENNSFEYSQSIAKLDGQSGWEGSIFFDAPSGDHILWTIHPSGGIDVCDRLSGFGIGITIP